MKESAAVINLRDINRKLVGLYGERDGMSAREGALKAEQVVAEAAKAEAERILNGVMADYAVGQATREAIDKAQDESDSSAKRYDKITQLLQTVSARLADVNNRLRLDLLREQERAELAVWREIFEDLRAELREKAGSLFLSLYVASRKAERNMLADDIGRLFDFDGLFDPGACDEQFVFQRSKELAKERGVE